LLNDYIKAALRRARYELLDDDDSVYAEVPELPGVWANAPTWEECRDQLAEVVEGWVLLGIKRGAEIPVLDSVDLNLIGVAEDVESY